MSDSKSPRTIKEDFSIIKRAVKLIESNTPHYLLHTFSFGFFSVAQGLGSNYITATIIDELTGGRDVKKLIILLSLYTFEIIFSVFRDYSWRRFRVFHIISMEWTEVLLNNKNFTMDYKNCEDSAVRAKRQMITDSNGIGGLDDMVYGILMLFQGLIEIVLCSAITAQMLFKHSAAALTSFEKVIDSGFTTVEFLAFVAVCSYFEFRVMGKYSRQSVPIVKNSSYIERILHYYLDDYLDDSKASKDVRIFNQQRLIERKTGDIFKKWSVSLAEHYRIKRKKNNAYNLFYVLTTAATYLYVGLKTYIGSFGLGGFFKYQYSISRIVNSASQLSQNIANLRSNNEYLLLLFDYLDMPSDMHYGTIPTEKRSDNVYDIEFHNVSFKYPGSDTYAIRKLSFKFKVGERVAVVGMNGSGKTTMIKLLCRLYDPTEGYITLNGIDIQKYDYEDYLALFSVVFQDFRLFSFSVGENIAASTDYDEHKVWDALTVAGLSERVDKMPEKLRTSIYKDFDGDGVEISGGEAQKLAIARALYKDAPFVILDEPTASLDPLAEYEIYSRFNEMVKDKTAVYISHRLSSCRFCDKIAVFHDGELIQFGSHESLLLDAQGKYSELWNAQAQYYQSRNKENAVSCQN